MTHGANSGDSQAIPDQVPTARIREAFRWMLQARVFDERLAACYRAGRIFGGVFQGRGQEALSASLGMALRRGDVFAPLIRDTAGRLAFGEPLIDGVRTYLGSALGPMRGRDGNVHRGRPREGLLPMISHLGSMVSVVNGMLMARRMKGTLGESVGATCLGDGATSTGAFHEALNQAAVERLPLVLVLANNHYAYSTPTHRQFVCERLEDKAAGYGVKSWSVDGTDIAACLATMEGAVAAARGGAGPQLVVATLLRLCGHGEHDDAGYIDPMVKASQAGRDCLQVAERMLLDRGGATLAELESMRMEAVDAMEMILLQVEQESGPDPFGETWGALATASLREGGRGA